ncbi:dihydrofolate reductase [Limibacter armeniacum]|uniref:dihydrofolate reductase n=1 Tax=Limibacter armeniacum TaxID=466084 RepID=UPI002FE6B3C0
MEISIIVAKSVHKNVIGKENKLVWHLPADLAHFKKRTSGHHIIMGRKTHESIKRKLPDRENIIITRNNEYEPAQGCVKAQSLEDAIQIAESNGEKEAFIIGGAQIYEQAIDLADTLYVTDVMAEFKGDTFFPQIDEKVWEEVSRFDFSKDDKNPYDYSFITYQRIK